MMNLVKSFVAHDSGAVAVDWVVLTGGMVGLGLATMSTVSGGVGALGGDINRALSSMHYVVTELASHSFTGGNMVGWVGGSVRDMGGEMGELLVLGPGESTGYTLDIPEGAAEAQMVFDLIAGDSLDASARWGTDTATVLINGVPIAIATSQAGSNLTFEIPQVDGTMVEATVTVSPTNYGGRDRWEDTEAEVIITVNDPVGQIEFEVVSSANQGINDEFWGIDGFEATVSE